MEPAPDIVNSSTQYHCLVPVGQEPTQMGLIYTHFLDGSDHKVLSCSCCATHLALPSDVISKDFQGRLGKAFLVLSVVNVRHGEPTDRTMTTGVHSVRDIHCNHCERVVGWKYDKAWHSTSNVRYNLSNNRYQVSNNRCRNVNGREPSQRYKEGKFILEKVSCS